MTENEENLIEVLYGLNGALDNYWNSGSYVPKGNEFLVKRINEWQQKAQKVINGIVDLDTCSQTFYDRLNPR